MKKYLCLVLRHRWAYDLGKEVYWCTRCQSSMTKELVFSTLALPSRLDEIAGRRSIVARRRKDEN